MWQNGQLFQITRTGLAAPGGGTFVAGVFAYMPINERGDVAFTFGLDPFAPAVLEGFAKAGLYRYSHTSQTLNAVVTPFVTSAPGIGTFQSTGLHASLNNSGEIAFSGVVKTNAGTSPHLGQGIFVVDEHNQLLEGSSSGRSGSRRGRLRLLRQPMDQRWW